MKRKKQNFVICINNNGYLASLEVGKVYSALLVEPQEEGCLRVIDETGEDYLFPAAFFVPIELPKEAQKIFIPPPPPPAKEKLKSS